MPWNFPPEKVPAACHCTTAAESSPTIRSTAISKSGNAASSSSKKRRIASLPRNSPIATKSSTASSVLNFMAVSRSLLLRASKKVRATSDGVGVSVSIGPPCCGVYVEKATQPVPTVPPVLAESSHHPWRRHRTRRSVPMGMIGLFHAGGRRPRPGLCERCRAWSWLSTLWGHDSRLRGADRQDRDRHNRHRGDDRDKSDRMGKIRADQDRDRRPWSPWCRRP